MPMQICRRGKAVLNSTAKNERKTLTGLHLYCYHHLRLQEVESISWHCLKVNRRLCS